MNFLVFLENNLQNELPRGTYYFFTFTEPFSRYFLYFCILNYQFSLYCIKGPSDLLDLATSRLQICMRDAAVRCVPKPQR
jgi:hypothetical protein